jgi:hypothetical protein
MKFVTLPILCELEDEDTSYNDLLDELNLQGDKERFWKDISFNKKILEEEMLSIEPRKNNEENSLMTFYGGSTLIVDLNLKELKDALNDTI